MHQKPLLFCDVDGVLSLWGFEADRCPPGVWCQVEGNPHFLSIPAAGHLHALSRDFDVVWCTGWEERADEHLPHLVGVPRGLPHLTFARNPGRQHAHWKLDEIEAYARGRALAWIDDALDESCHAWAAARSAPTLLVPTDPARGLGDDEAALLRGFAQRAGRG